MRKSRFSEERIIGVLRRVEKGQSLVEVCREEGISDATYYRWKAQYGGLEVNQLRRLRHLEEENRKLKQVAVTPRETVLRVYRPGEAWAMDLTPGLCNSSLATSAQGRYTA